MGTEIGGGWGELVAIFRYTKKLQQLCSIPKNTEIVQVFCSRIFKSWKICKFFFLSMEANTTCSLLKNQETLLMARNCSSWDDSQILSLEE